MIEKKTDRDLSLGKRVVFSVIITCCLVVGAELAIRVWAYFFRTSYEQYNPATGRLELVPNIRYTTRTGNEFWINSKGFLGPEFRDHKNQSVYRIFAIGDSCTFGDGTWKNAYPALVEQLLNGKGSRNKFEVINAGIEGYNSSFALDRVNDTILRYEPDLIMVYVGWNDLMKSDPHSMANSSNHTLFARFKQQSYLVKAYRKLIFYYIRPVLWRPKLVNNKGGSSSFDDYVPNVYRDNLQAMIKALKVKGIKIILFTLPTVLTPQMTYEDLQKQNVVFPYYSGAYSVADFLSIVHAYNKVIRELGEEYNVPIVDLFTVFNNMDKRGLFWDTMHPSYEGHHLIARSVFERIEAIQLDEDQCRAFGWDSLCLSQHN